MLVLIILTAFTIKTEAKEFDASEFVLKNNKNSLVQSDLNRYDFDILDTKAKEIFARQIPTLSGRKNSIHQ